MYSLSCKMELNHLVRTEYEQKGEATILGMVLNRYLNLPMHIQKENGKS